MLLKIKKCMSILKNISIPLADLACLSVGFYLIWSYAHLFYHLLLFGTIILEINRQIPRDYRPARTVLGLYGQLEIPDSRDQAACNEFKSRQIELYLRARGEQNNDLMNYHLANLIFVLINPMESLLAYSRIIPSADFQRVQFHFRNLYHQFYGLEEID